ncbi:hypothetical protein [uncultured Ruminococcus sp.]|uniref:hypothetical protein n=1 Tax=uncultured Ruminococcus sp. TaxID=165186 RepID=UPI0029303A74|nr:hypothetical protein [uncultured Ruminococcus sp.]
MTNTKFRKRALLSSVAMLLVALVALGSATFAWFAANPDAEAHGISMKTTAAAGLVVKTDTDGEWSHSAKLNNADNNATFNATPASIAYDDPAGTITNDIKFWTVIAANSSNYGAKSGESMTTVDAGRSGTDEVYMEHIYCRLSDGSDAAQAASKKFYIKGVSIADTNPNPK